MDTTKPPTRELVWSDGVMQSSDGTTDYIDGAILETWPSVAQCISGSHYPVSDIVAAFESRNLLAACGYAETCNRGLSNNAFNVWMQPSIWSCVDAESQQGFLRLFSQVRTRPASPGGEHFRFDGIRVDPATWEAYRRDGPVDVPIPPPARVPWKPEPVSNEELTLTVVAAKTHFKNQSEAEIIGAVMYALDGRDVDRERLIRFVRETRSQRRDRRAKEERGLLAVARGLEKTRSYSTSPPKPAKSTMGS